MIYKMIGKKIRALRVLHNMTQEMLAEKAGISLSFLGHIERGTRKLSVDTLYKIAIVLDCSVDQLMDTGRYRRDPEDGLKALLKDALVLLEK